MGFQYNRFTLVFVMWLHYEIMGESSQQQVKLIAKCIEEVVKEIPEFFYLVDKIIGY